ncbi:Histidyl-tRNA synthetase [Mycoplasmopsis bovis 8790]|nr:Histidyl-tRNA synthetase [Mycoplasmopsis bovis 8790]
MFNRVKGTSDYITSDIEKRGEILREFFRLIELNCFNLVETPILELADLYKRSVAGSDIVSKEMYEFTDKGNRMLSLRPEGTAGFIRALIENKWHIINDEFWPRTTKFAYYGPMFRYEQPQKGRMRQFYQAGVEIIDGKSGDLNIYQDAELINMAYELLDSLSVGFVLKINSIGDQECRNKYQEELRKYLEQYKDELTPISQERLKNNVFRILDDKVDSQKPFMKKAPKLNDFLSSKSRDHFTKTLMLLDILNIKYEIDFSLVRGLDYYDEIVYEFVSSAKDAGSQATIIGGGRYSNLVKELGGPDLFAAGWGLGIDRLIDIMKIEQGEKYSQDIEDNIDIVIGTSNPDYKILLFGIAKELRDRGFSTNFIYESIKSKKIYEKAQKNGAQYLISDDEKDPNGYCFVKNLFSGKKIKFNLISENSAAKVLDFIDESEDIF